MRQQTQPCHVSIVIPALDEEEYLPTLLDSLVVQTYRDFEVIVVDDKSTDNTRAVAQSYSDRLDLICLLKEGSRGIAASRNLGASHAKGTLLLFLDADVCLAPDSLECWLHEFYERSCDLAFIDFWVRDRDLFDRLIIKIHRWRLRCLQYVSPRGVGFALLVKRSLHEQGGFDTTILLSEDFEYVNRLSKLGKFRILTKAPIEASWRRFDNEPRVQLVLKYLWMEWYRKYVGEIRSPMISYPFGKSKTSDPQNTTKCSHKK